MAFVTLDHITDIVVEVMLSAVMFQPFNWGAVVQENQMEEI